VFDENKEGICRNKSKKKNEEKCRKCRKWASNFLAFTSHFCSNFYQILSRNIVFDLNFQELQNYTITMADDTESDAEPDINEVSHHELTQDDSSPMIVPEEEFPFVI